MFAHSSHNRFKTTFLRDSSKRDHAAARASPEGLVKGKGGWDSAIGQTLRRNPRRKIRQNAASFAFPGLAAGRSSSRKPDISCWPSDGGRFEIRAKRDSPQEHSCNPGRANSDRKAQRKADRRAVRQ